jgi:hypothetical protein
VVWCGVVWCGVVWCIVDLASRFGGWVGAALLLVYCVMSKVQSVALTYHGGRLQLLLESPLLPPPRGGVPIYM